MWFSQIGGSLTYFLMYIYIYERKIELRCFFSINLFKSFPLLYVACSAYAFCKQLFFHIERFPVFLMLRNRFFVKNNFILFAYYN